MSLSFKNTITIILLFILLNSTAYADIENSNKETNFEEYDNTQDKALLTKNLHSQLNAIFSRNQHLKSTLSTTDESLNTILSTLESLDNKLEYKLNAGTTISNSTSLTLSDFNSNNDDLVLQCDEIVDNYYTRKSQQEKNYVQDLFYTEQNDPQWERDVENRIQNFINDNSLSQSAFYDVNCTLSVCKIRVQHQSSEAARLFKHKLRDDTGFSVYETRNKRDRVTGGIISSVTFLKDRKKVREFVWGE